jgi:hypothetical protein
MKADRARSLPKEAYSRRFAKKNSTVKCCRTWLSLQHFSKYICCITSSCWERVRFAPWRDAKLRGVRLLYVYRRRFGVCVGDDVAESLGCSSSTV